MGFPRSDDEILRFWCLEHHPHGLDIVARESPIAFGIQVSQIEVLLDPEFDPRRSFGDLATDECFTPSRRFVVEENAVTGEEIIGLAVVNGHPVGIHLCCAIRTSRIKWSGFSLRHLEDFSEHFAGGRLIELRLQPGLANGFQKTNGPQSCDFSRVLRNVEAHTNVTLCPKVVYFFWLDCAEYTIQ